MITQGWITSTRNGSTSAYTARYEFETLEVSSPCDRVLHVQLHRPETKNAICKEMGREIGECFRRIHDDKHCRAVIISGSGDHFSAGLDYKDLSRLIEKISGQSSDDSIGEDVVRKAKYINGLLSQFQESFSAIETCAKPVIAVVTGGCIGAGMSLVASADIRYASKDAFFQMKEVDIGMTADMGSIQRLPKAIGNNSLFREMIYSAMKVPASEARDMGMVSKVLPDELTAQQAAIELAKMIVTKSPIAVQGSKVCLRYSRDHSVYDGLRFVANWNMTMLQSEDLLKATSAIVSKSEEPPEFADL